MYVLIVAIVRDSNGVPVQYGLPCDWDDGIAERVLQRTLQVTNTNKSARSLLTLLLYGIG
jgi:hypothetical protein